MISPLYNPPPDTWHENLNGKIQFGSKRYDGDYLTFQIIFGLIPCLACSYFLVTTQGNFFLAAFIYCAVLGFIIFWIISNIKNEIIFTIDGPTMTIKKGFPLSLVACINMDLIEEVFIHKKYGGTGRSSWNSGTAEVQELIIKLKNGKDCNLGSFFNNRHKLYFKLLIEYYLHNKS